jgi:hypothetical protein
MNNKKCNKQPLAVQIASFIGIALASLFAVIATCSRVPIAGSGTEEGNPGKVIGFVYDTLNRPVAGAVVRLLPHDYNPVHNASLPDSLSTLTDSNGSYRFSLSDTGHFSIYCIDQSNGTKTLHSNVLIAGGDTNILHDTLLRPGRIKVVLPDSLDTINGYLYFPGTTIYSWLCADNGYVILDSVPGNIHLSIYYAVNNSAAAPRLIKDSIIAVPGTTTTVAYVVWKYSKKLYLNTSSSGADVSGNVYDFPVLIRLTRPRFNFEQAAGNGEDIRFTKTDGSQLPYEIEHWDSAAGKADIWVKIDTIYANSDSHYFTMIWGNPGAQKINSDGAAVFDTMTGFKGVWHFGDPVNSNVKDQTSNSFNGIATATTTVPGIIGMAQSFNGVSSEISVSGPAIEKLNFKEDGIFSISAWVRIDTIDSLFHGIVFKSNFQYGLQLRPANQWEFMHYKDKSGWEMSRATAVSGSWQHLSGVRNGNKQFLYVNGVCVDSSIVSVATNSPRATDQPLEIGHCPDGGKDPDRFFKGIIDEVHIAGIARSADWIKLCYLNQNQEDQLLRW